MSPGGAPRGPAPAAAPAARPQAMPRARRLKRRRLIRPLFGAAAGRVAAGTVQLRWALAPRSAVGSDAPLQVGFAPGRRAMTKVTRNRIRRIMRETWRLRQAPLIEPRGGSDATLTVFALYRGDAGNAAAEIRRDLPVAMDRLLAAAAGEDV